MTRQKIMFGGEIKKTKVFFLAAMLLLTGCSTRLTAQDVLGSIFVLEQPSPATQTPTVTAIQTLLPTATPVPTATIPATATPSQPKTYDTQRQRITALMEGYGFVEDYYLSDTYWDQLVARIEAFGAAEKISALEFHGNNYSMYDGFYSMNPEAFYGQMETMMANQYHFVTIHELQGFLEGWLDLPKRSIILTTDSGAGSKESFNSIIGQFSELEIKFGYRPHMQSYIWTAGMKEEENLNCRDNACWKLFVDTKETGFFTFGTHSQSHVSMGNYGAQFIREDLITSRQKILENTGLNVYGLTWPHESCSQESGALKEIGINFAFGGHSKSGLDLFVYKTDGMVNCLPRIFPPNPSGYSSRPVGFTLVEILKSQEN
ncbi:MAG: polysaccharide deacetylase family protein [Anaerolineaceae bacterium]